MHTRDQLADGFRALGVRPGDVIFLHASVRAVGTVAGGPDQIHLALKDALTPAGTLVMYASCPQYVDEVGRGHLAPAFEAELLEQLPAFDPDSARSARENGALVELFRTYPGSRVNQHPARFVVWGAATGGLLTPQPWDYAFGHGSLLERFVELDGKILLLGSDHDQVTFLHYAEHIVDIPDKRVARFQVPMRQDGDRVWRWMAEYDTADGVHAHWPEDFFARLVDHYLAEMGTREGTVGGATSVLFSARGLLEFALPIMRAVAGDREAADRLVPARIRRPSDAPLAAERMTLPGTFGAIDIYLFDQLLRGRIAPGMRVLDAGCGSGRNLHYLLREGFDVSAVDEDADAVEEVRRLARRVAPYLGSDQFRVEPIEACTFADGSFDVIISSAVLHFARDDRQFEAMLAAMWRVLKPGGLLFCRLASTIGLEGARPVGDNRYRLPDGSERYLVSAERLTASTRALGGRLLDPLKTTVVQNQRSMTTWVVGKET